MVTEADLMKFKVPELRQKLQELGLQPRGKYYNIIMIIVLIMLIIIIIIFFFLIKTFDKLNFFFHKFDDRFESRSC